jgi:hypothetical protein
MDFDRDSCYNAPAIDALGNVNEGMDMKTGRTDGCRSPAGLTNVYARKRCNNDWCAYLYDYYMVKDVKKSNGKGHRHEWEHVIVFTFQGQAKIVAASAHGDYKT